MNFFLKSKKIKADVKKAGFFGKGTGLMFRTKKTENLLFDFSKNCRIAIHSYFVFFPFLIVWLDYKNRAVDWRVVYPFTLSVYPKKEFRKFLEIPINDKNKGILSNFIE